MSAMDFEYAIKKDIRNNPIVREVDEARQRQLWRSVGIGAVPGRSCCSSRPGSTSSCCATATRSQRMQQERAAEEEVNRHLRLEIETLRSPRAHRADRDRTAAPGGADARPGDRHRAGDAGGAPREVHRRGALSRARQETPVADRTRHGRFGLPWRGLGAAGRCAREPRAGARRLARDHARRACSSAPSLFALLDRRRSRRGSSTCRSSSTPT